VPTLLRWPVSRVLVVGPSMVPTLRHGDALVVRRGAAVRPGDLVIARFPRGPELLVVKRAIRPAGNGWWLEGDNPLVADDSRAYGPGIVLARVLFRYWPIRRAQRH
jgi:phage repressor protein C with HTH and peptisase S24 domain